MPQTFYTQQEYMEVLQRAIQAEQKVAALESMRPQWANGYTSDSMVAQASTSALQSIWDLLGVTNQTQAMQTIRFLMLVKGPR